MSVTAEHKDACVKHEMRVAGMRLRGAGKLANASEYLFFWRGATPVMTCLCHTAPIA